MMIPRRDRQLFIAQVILDERNLFWLLSPDAGDVLLPLKAIDSACIGIHIITITMVELRRSASDCRVLQAMYRDLQGTVAQLLRMATWMRSTCKGNHTEYPGTSAVQSTGENFIPTRRRYVNGSRRK